MVAGGGGPCVIAGRGVCMVAGGGACMVAGGGACMVAGGHTWLPGVCAWLLKGMRVCWGGMCGC